MTNKKDNTDWEQQLASIIEKSNHNLAELTSEYNRAKAKRPASHEVLHLPARAAQPKPIKEFRCVKKQIEGPHEKAALDAVNAAIIRPVSRPSEDDIMRRIETRTRLCIEKALDEKLISMSRAIDAVRDQICVMADEVRELHNQASRTTKSLSSQERRIDVICHDVDTKRNSIEAHLADEISSIKHLFAQSFEKGISTTVSPIELKSALETSELNTKMLISTALAPLRNSFRAELSGALKEFASERDSLQGLVDEKMETIESKLLKSQRSQVKMEIESTTKKCLGVLESNVDRLAETLKQNADELATGQRKETVVMITQIVDSSVAEIERNLTDRLTTTLEEKAKELQDQATLKPNTLTATKEEVETLQQAISTINNELQNVKDKLKELEERTSSAESSRKKTDSDISLIVDSLSRHKKMIQKLVTRDELQNVTEHIMNENADRVSSIKCELESASSELARDWANKFSSLKEKLSTFQSFDVSIADVTYLEARVEEIENADFKGKLDKILDVVESFEQRVQAIENDGKSEESPFMSRDSVYISKVELGKLINELEDRSKTEIALLSARIHALEIQESKRPFPIFSAHDGSHEEHVFKENRTALSRQTDDFCDSLGEAITKLHCTLNDAKELGCSNKVAESNILVLSTLASQQQIEMLRKDGDHTPVKLRTPNPTKPEDIKSPCVHLMGLSSSASHDTCSTSMPRQSVAKKDLNTSQLATNEFKGPVEVVKYFNDLAEDTKTPRPEASLTAIKNCETQDALSLCGVLTDDSMEGSVIAATNSPFCDSRLSAASNPSFDDLVRTGEDDSLSPKFSKSYDANALSDVDIPGNGCSNALKGGRNSEPISCSHSCQSHDTADQPICLHNDASDSSPISQTDTAPGKPCTHAQDDAVSIPGSITSFDEVEYLSNSVIVIKKKASVLCNPTRNANPTPYEGWDRLLTELRASGRILKDSDDVDSATSRDDGPVGVDNGFEHECSVSYDSSFESEGEF